MSRRNTEGPKPRFNLRRAAAVTAVETGFGMALDVAFKAGTAWVFVEPISGTLVLTAAAGAAAVAIPAGIAGHYVIHLLDDPVFDMRTTILFDLTGIAFGFLLFVLPAMQFEATLKPGGSATGALSLLALGLTIFAVILLRGLLMNLGIVRDGEHAERDRLPL